MNVLARQADPKRKTYLLAICLAVLCVLSSCQDTMLPLSEYQFVTAIPIDDVGYGILFAVDSTLYVLHGNEYELSMIKQFNISNPDDPILENATYLSIPIYVRSPMATNRHRAFFYDYYQLIGMDFNTFASHSQLVDFQVYDLAYSAQYLFLNTNSGLRIWDVQSWPDYTEVYYDSMLRYNGRTVIDDTILFEFYKPTYQTKKYAFRNIKNPNEPYVISEGTWVYEIRDISMNEMYVIYAEGYSIHRYSHESYDTLILEELVGIQEGVYNHVLSDSLIYVQHRGSFTVLALNDFRNRVKTSLQTGLYEPFLLALTPFENFVITLVYESGIIIFERIEQ